MLYRRATCPSRRRAVSPRAEGQVFHGPKRSAEPTVSLRRVLTARNNEGIRMKGTAADAARYDRAFRATSIDRRTHCASVRASSSTFTGTLKYDIDTGRFAKGANGTAPARV
jgi:hypothetical protein